MYCNDNTGLLSELQDKVKKMTLDAEEEGKRLRREVEEGEMRLKEREVEINERDRKVKQKEVSNVMFMPSANDTNVGC